METEIIKVLTIGGTPVTIIGAGILLYKWTAFHFKYFRNDLNEIKQALNCKVSKELYDSQHEDLRNRVERLETAENGR